MSSLEHQVLLAGIGTLLLQESLGDTVSQDNASDKLFEPVIITGYKRPLISVCYDLIFYSEN